MRKNYAGKLIFKATDRYARRNVRSSCERPILRTKHTLDDEKQPILRAKRCHKTTLWMDKRETMPQDKDDKSSEEGGASDTALKTGPSAPVHSSTTTSSTNTSEDDLQHDSDIARSSGGGTTTSTSPAEVEEAQATSRKKRKHHHGDRFSFREPFLYKVSSKQHIGNCL